MNSLNVFDEFIDAPVEPSGTDPDTGLARMSQVDGAIEFLRVRHPEQNNNPIMKLFLVTSVSPECAPLPNAASCRRPRRRNHRQRWGYKTPSGHASDSLSFGGAYSGRIGAANQALFIHRLKRSS